MKRVVILGAGFGGLAIAAELDDLAKSGKVDAALIDKNTHFSMGFSMQWVMAGRRRPEDGQRPYAALQMRNVKFIHDEIAVIDATQHAVKTKSRALNYDYLVIALGAELAPEIVPGLSEGAYNLCDLRSVIQLKAAVESVERGTVVIAISSVPFKCPPSPYEYALLIDDILRQRGVRKDVRIFVTTPEPQPMPVAGKAVGDAVQSMLAERGVEFLPKHKPKLIDVGNHRIVYENDSELSYDILGAMPPHRAPRVVKDLIDGSGFIPADLWTLKTSNPEIYAAGDVASLKLPDGKPHPKAGVFAESQATAVARNIAALIEGKDTPPSYNARGVCYVDTGQNKAAPAEADLLAAEGHRVILKPPSEEGLESKRNFEREHFIKWFGG